MPKFRVTRNREYTCVVDAENEREAIKKTSNFLMDQWSPAGIKLPHKVDEIQQNNQEPK